MIEVTSFTTDDAPPGLLPRIRDLLTTTFARFDEHDWKNALGGRHFVALDDGQPVAHAAIVPRRLEVGGRAVHAGYGEGVATLADVQGSGLGSSVMTPATRHVIETYGMGALATGSHHFYERLGWERWQGPTYVRDGGVVRRSPDDDDAVMVLRVPGGATFALDADLLCDSRPGDDW